MSALSQEQIEIVHHSLLRFIQAGGGGISTAYLLQFVRGGGFGQFTGADLDAALRYLSGKGLIMEVPKLLNPENRHWQLSALGMDYLGQLKKQSEE